MIPKIIHYCWFGGNPFPKEVKSSIKSWKKYAVGYEIKLWNENNFDIDQHLFVKSAYEAKAWAFVSDYARLKIIYDQGGIYLDTDVELIKNIDFLLKNKSYFGIEQVGHYCATGLGFGAEAGNSVVKEMLEEYDGILFKEETKEKIACPILNDKVITRHGYRYTDQIWQDDNMTIYPCRYFDPLSPGNGENLLCEDTISIHHYAASWMNWSTRTRRKIIRAIGEERVDLIKKVLNRKG